MTDLSTRLQRALGDSYRLERELGGGGMSRVFLASESSLGRSVVVKVLPPELASEVSALRFKQEIEVAARLQHPNVVPVLSAGSNEGLLYYVMPLASGESLRQLLAREGKLSVLTAARILYEVADALAHAHAQGVIHRDIKPENILLESGHALLIDFGVSRALEAARGREGLTGTGMRMGTPGYMPPEQVAGEAPLDGRADVYALGVVGYEMLSGKPPFEGPTSQAVLVAHLTKPPRPLREHRPDVPARLEAAIMKALAKTPDERLGSAIELRDAIGFELPRELGASTRRTRIGVIGGVAALAVGVAVLVIPGVGPAPSPGGSLNGEAGAHHLALAVLPFAYEGPAGQEYYADGMSDAIHAQLSGLSELRVVAYDGVARDHHPDRRTSDVGAELGVGYVLDGEVGFEHPTDPAGWIRMTSRLVRVSDGHTVWSQTFEERMENLFAVQSAVAREVAQVLRLAQHETWPERWQAGATPDMQAYRYYLRGNEFLRFHEDEQRLRLAEASYSQALARDSTFAEAWARLSTTHTHLWFFRYDRTEERLERAREAAERALDLHPELPDSYYALAFFQYQGLGDYHQARRYFERVLELQPNHLGAIRGLAWILRRQGRLEEALSFFIQLALLDPLDPSATHGAAFTQQLLRHYPEAEALYASAHERAGDQPLFYATWALLRMSETGATDEARQILARGVGSAADNDFVRHVTVDLDLMGARYEQVAAQLASWDQEVLDTQPWYTPLSQLQAAAYRGMGNLEAARNQERIALGFLEDRLREHPDDHRLHGALSRLYASLGRADDAIRAAQRGVELMPHDRDAVVAPFRVEDLAAAYVAAGRIEDAIDQVEALLSAPGLVTATRLAADPRWRPLWAHPRFQALVRAEREAKSGTILR